jgi:glycosyltransferase involved in cell wall biosynthesis
MELVPSLNMTSNSISVVIPAYNAEKTIRRALNSVENQSLLPKEVIVIDDCSSDQTNAVIREFIKESRLVIRHEVQPVNSGAGSARNAGWLLATEKYVAFLDADDIWHPNKLEIQFNAMENSYDFSMSCHYCRVTELEDWSQVQLDASVQRLFTFKDFLIRNRCATPSVMVKREIPVRFQPGKRYAEDYLLWLQTSALYGPVLFIDLPLVHCSNPIYGGPGLSGNLKQMHKGESAALRQLRKEGLISLSRFIFYVLWWNSKYMFRQLDTKVLKIRS